VNLIPEVWLHWEDTDETPEAIREVYFQFLATRLNHSQIFINEAQNAREALI
jgi:6-pyruvoyl-tetrahydropterin synthase